MRGQDDFLPPLVWCAQQFPLPIAVEHKGSEIEKRPYRGFIQMKVPTDDFEAMMWQV